MATSESVEKDQKKKKRNSILFGVILAILVMLLVWILYFLFYGRFFVSTEDAYVSGNQVPLTNQVDGGVVAIYADNTDLVLQGQVVVLLDKTNYLLKLEESKQKLANTVREVVGLFEAVKEKEAAVEVRRAELIQAKLNFSHRTPEMVESGSVGKEEFEQYGTNVAVGEANYTFALRDLDSAKALVAGTTVKTHPRVTESVTQLKNAYLDLIRCEVIAPASGYVARRSAQVGDWVVAGTSLLKIVPLDYLWVDANYKEIQLGRVRIGQKANFTADIYGRSVKYHGTVVGFTGGTGSAFALLPAQNASGNWIKIVQRLPVRIAIDPEELRKNPLFIGLSTRMEIDVHDTNGKMLCAVAQDVPAYTTFIYEQQDRKLENFSPEIQKIIDANYQQGSDGASGS